MVKKNTISKVLKTYKKMNNPSWQRKQSAKIRKNNVKKTKKKIDKYLAWRKQQKVNATKEHKRYCKTLHDTGWKKSGSQEKVYYYKYGCSKLYGDMRP